MPFIGRGLAEPQGVPSVDPPGPRVDRERATLAATDGVTHRDTRSDERDNASPGLRQRTELGDRGAEVCKLRSPPDMQRMPEEVTPFHTAPMVDGRSNGELAVDRGGRGKTPIALVRAGFWGSFVALPLAAAAAAYATAPSARSRRSRPAMAAAGTAFGLALVRWQLDGRFSDEPVHETEAPIGDLQVRRYAPVVVAETTLAGADWDEARESGFRRLADYISGKNTERAHIELTPPVHVAKNRMNAGEKIAMTAPVAITEHAGGHTVMFVMPEGRTLASLPVPLDSRIQLRELPARRLALLRFAGGYRWAPVHRKMRELLTKVERAGLRTEGEVHFGGYDPPWTLPFLRRNEVWIELAPKGNEPLTAART
jgi:hypothetical protein